MAGNGIVVASVTLVKVTRGGKKPLSVAYTSNLAEGFGVVASDLVKLYQEAYSTTAGKASSTDGYSFTVPVSGRYEFNFNCTGWNSNGGTIKLTFNVRQGTTVLASDYHQSISSNIWAEYEGRVEGGQANLNSSMKLNVINSGCNIQENGCFGYVQDDRPLS